MAKEEDAAYQPGDVLKWLIKETGGIGIKANANSNTNEENENSSENKEDSSNQGIDKFSSMSADERAKWMNVILGKTDEQINFQKRLETTMIELNQIVAYRRTRTLSSHNNDNDKDNDTTNDKNAPSKASMDAFILKSLKMIHDLTDQNEMALVKNNLLNTLFELLLNNDELLDIRLQCISILNDITQNNPIIRNEIYLLKDVKFLNKSNENGVRLVTQLLFNLSFDNNKQALNSQIYNYSKYYQFRSKIWNLILHSCSQHNPNLNVFLSEKGYQLISSLLQKCHKQNITEESMSECLRVSRFVNYLLGEWSDANAEMIRILGLFQPMHWFVYTLHEYLRCLLNETIAKARAGINPVNDNNTSKKMDHLHPNVAVSTKSTNNSNSNSNNNNNSSDPFRLAASILDTLYYLLDGISAFMRRGSKCRRYIIVENKDLVKELTRLNDHFETYIKDEIEIIKKNKERAKQKEAISSDMKGNDDNDDTTNDDNSESEASETEIEDLDPRIRIMQDIVGSTGSILRHVTRYENDRAHHMKMENMWKKHHSQKVQTQQSVAQARKAHQKQKHEKQQQKIQEQMQRAQLQHQHQQQQQQQYQQGQLPNDTREIVLYRDPNKGKQDTSQHHKKSHSNRKRHQKSKRR